MKSLLFILFCSVCIILNNGLTNAQDAKTIIEKADQLVRGNTSYSEMTMKVVRPDWSREVGIKSWSKGRNLALIYITAPARDKGSAFLLRKPEVWNWIPSVKESLKYRLR